MLTISGLTYRVGGRHGRALFNEANASIPEGAKLGLVGRNGAGKSTLSDLIRGRLLPDRGDIFLPRGHRIGLLAQEAPGGSASALDTVLAADKERSRLLAELDKGPEPLRIAEIEDRLVEIGARAAPARAARILAGLGLDAAMQARPLSELSGGWRMRVALAAVLFAEPDLMLLDEPTNHLDLEAALWLENYLRRYRHSFVLVSHDRQLLNAATTTTLHLDGGKLTLYSGGFDQFLRARREAATRQAVLARQQQKQRAHLQEFVDRFRAKASKARQAQSRMKALARLEPVALVTDAAPPYLAPAAAAGIEPADHQPRPCQHRLRAGPAGPVAPRPAARPRRPDRAVGRQRQRQDHFRPPPRRQARAAVRADGSFAQADLRVFRPASDRGDAAGRLCLRSPRRARCRTARPRRCAPGLGGFGFGQDKAFVPVSELSGGERARLNFALVTHDAPSLLILDEPTNHLDMETREALVRSACRIFRGGGPGQPRLASGRIGRRSAVAGRRRHGAAVR